MADQATTVPVAEGLFIEVEGAPRLVGGTCLDCGAVAFPLPASCVRCTSEAIDEHLLAPAGTLWSWTVQRFAPKEPYAGPEPFEPYGVGYIDLDGEVLVESRLTVADPDQLSIGDRMELEIVPFVTRPDGTEVVTFAFRPAAQEVGA